MELQKFLSDCKIIKKEKPYNERILIVLNDDLVNRYDLMEFIKDKFKNLGFYKLYRYYCKDIDVKQIHIQMMNRINWDFSFDDDNEYIEMDAKMPFGNRFPLDDILDVFGCKKIELINGDESYTKRQGVKAQIIYDEILILSEHLLKYGELPIIEFYQQ